MKKCVNCDVEYDDDTLFCPKCGSKLQSDKAVCAACGAELPEDAAFCPKCGAKTASANVCAACGAELVEGSNFCPKCGATRGGAAVPKKSEKPRMASEVRDKIVAFENNRHILSNAAVIVLAVVILFVSLFAPIKIASSALTASGDVSSDADNEIGLSIYQVLGSWKYVDYDANDDADLKKETTNKNALAIMLMMTANSSNDMYKTMYTEAYTALIFATLAAVVHIWLAAASLVFIVLAILGMLRKKDAPITAYFKSMLISSGVALILLAISPMLVNLGGMFAVALTTALVYLAYGTCAAILRGKSALCLVKSAVISMFAILSFFLLCGYILWTDMSLSGSSDMLLTNEYVGILAPLGFTLDSILVSILFRSIPLSNEVSIGYSGLSSAVAGVALLIFVIAMALALAFVVSSLSKVAKIDDDRSGVRVLSAMLAIVLFVGILVVDIMSAAVSAPDFSDIEASSRVIYIGIAFKFFARVQMYFSLAFVVASIIFDALFRPRKAAKAVESA